ncbi:MAG: hypothetical protein DCC53_06560 [Chloroflexi bacterium]|nr:MAG: hypothetical protein DCC53_06560 [Chloroflexota bacterium]
MIEFLQRVEFAAVHESTPRRTSTIQTQDCTTLDDGCRTDPHLHPTGASRGCHHRHPYGLTEAAPPIIRIQKLVIYCENL